MQQAEVSEACFLYHISNAIFPGKTKFSVWQLAALR